MAELLTTLKLFAYEGRENGLMVVGSRAAMTELATALSNALESQEKEEAKDWPPHLVSAAVQYGPYTNSKNWKVSFHLEGSVSAQSTIRGVRSSSPVWFKLAALALATVGIFSLGWWAWNAF